MSLGGISSVGKGNGTDLTITVQHGNRLSDNLYKAPIYNQCSNVAAKTIVDSSGRSRIFSSDSDKIQLCDSYYSKEFDYLDIDISACPTVSDDVRVKFHCSSKEVKKAYEKCAFYFWYVF